MFGNTGPRNPASWASLGFMRLEGFQSARVADPSEALGASRRFLAAGVDGLKVDAVTLGGVTLPQPAIQVAVQVAHDRGKPVFRTRRRVKA